LEGDRPTPDRSRYAAWILDALRAKGQGQVLNRSEILRNEHGLEYLCPERYRLEPAWTAVLLAVLVYTGDVVLTVGSRKLDATALDALVQSPIDELEEFRHGEFPRGWDLPALRSLLGLLGL